LLGYDSSKLYLQLIEVLITYRGFLANPRVFEVRLTGGPGVNCIIAS
jgi:hypothetical protein